MRGKAKIDELIINYGTCRGDRKHILLHRD